MLPARVDDGDGAAADDDGDDDVPKRRPLTPPSYRFILALALLGLEMVFRYSPLRTEALSK